MSETNGAKCPKCGWEVDAECTCGDFTDSNKQATPERIAELKELGEEWLKKHRESLKQQVDS